MKIAIFSDNFYPELSGIADSIIVLGKELSKQGHAVRFYGPRYADKDFKRVGLTVKELDMGLNVSVHRFASMAIPSATQQSRMVIPTPWVSADIKDFKPDVIHSQSFFGTGLNALRAAKKLKIPFVGTNHTAIGEFFRMNTPLKSKESSGLVVKFAVWYYNKCSFVSAPSESVFKELMEYGLRQPHHVISNPIDTETFSPAVPVRRTELKHEFKFSPHTLFYAGRLGIDKAIDVTVRALPAVKQKFPDVLLAIAGHGETETSLRALAKELDVEDNVRFLGTLDKPTLAKAYQAADIFTIMSLSETQSLTLMQAMASGIPVIGARARALPEYINDQNGFLVEPGDHATLATRIIDLLSNDAMRDELGRGGRTFAEQFSPANIARAWLSVYEKAVMSHR